jgi:maltooligosyltrehalose trehalohydrolase
VEIWAPRADGVELIVAGRRRSLSPGRDGEHTSDDGWWHGDAPDLRHGTEYAFSVDGGPPLPDPRSRRQPDGVHGPSRVHDARRFEWSAAEAQWRGRPLHGAVFYELHVGTFTPEGTLEAAIDHLDHLAHLGITHVELLPIAPFDGPRGWGYDSVFPFAVHERYGGPDGLDRFVDAAHGRDLAVVLDVVHNHAGPGSEMLAAFGPYFTDRNRTPWGPAANLDGPGSDEARRYLIDSALAWFRDHHVDGLRLDATDALVDERSTHFLAELSTAVDALAEQLGRPLLLVAESTANDPKVVSARAERGFGVHAQWNDDFHHALHALLTGERQGYYCDFGSVAALATCLTNGYFLDGRRSTFWGGTHGYPIDPTLPRDRLVAYLQNHDQIGNRMAGERLGALVSTEAAQAGAALLLTSPFTPLLFMGEEWGATTPWQFFTSFGDHDRANTTRRGRSAKGERLGWAAVSAGTMPDPQDPDTMRQSTLDWLEVDREPHRGLLDWYTRLIALRSAEPDLVDDRSDSTRCWFDEQRRWLVVRRGRFRIAVNLGHGPQALALSGGAATRDQAQVINASIRLTNDPTATVRVGGIAGAAVVLGAPAAAIVEVTP